jgi:hypothetical protein
MAKQAGNSSPISHRVTDCHFNALKINVKSQSQIVNGKRQVEKNGRKTGKRKRKKKLSLKRL